MAYRPTPGVQDDLAECKCFVLESMRVILVKNVDPTKFLPFLRSKFVLSGHESDTIKSCCSKSVSDGADKLVDVLCTKGAKGYDVFCDAIVHDKTQVFLLTELNKRLEFVKHVKKEQEKARAEQEKARAEQEKARAEQVRQRIMLEQRQLQEQSEVRPYLPQPGAGSAHTTTCLNYIPHCDPRAQYMDQVRMPSRSPNAPINEQYPIPDQVRMPSRSPNAPIDEQYPIPDQVRMPSQSPIDQQYPPQQYTTQYSEWNGMETTPIEQTDSNLCGQPFTD